MIRFTNASVCYDGPNVVRDVELEVGEGNLHVLLGDSGSGKTTLLRAIAGFEPLSSGRLEIAGELVDDGNGRRVAPEKRHVGVVFQDYALFPHLDVAGNIAFGQRSKDPKRVSELLESVGLAGYGDRPVAALSGGEQQRVALARAMAQAPRIILFDEPFSNLNRGLRQTLRRQTVAILREQEITGVFVTHNRDEAFAIADTISVLADGEILATGDPLDLYVNPRRAGVAEALGECSLIAGTRHGDVMTCSLGEVAVRGDGELLVVRPETVAVSDAADAINAAVTYVEYAGNRTRLWLDLTGDELTIFTKRKGLSVGENIAIELLDSELAAVVA